MNKRNYFTSHFTTVSRQQSFSVYRLHLPAMSRPDDFMTGVKKLWKKRQFYITLQKMGFFFVNFPPGFFVACIRLFHARIYLIR